MSSIKFIASTYGLLPFDDEARIWLSGCKKGQMIECKVSKTRNYEFHKKYFGLLNTAFDWWVPSNNHVETKYGKPEKNLEEFRSNVIIMAGYYDAIYNVRGEVKLKAKSISFAKMDEIEFQDLYSKTITVLLKILPSHISEDDLNNATHSILEFA